jgi:hypothetical protein
MLPVVRSEDALRDRTDKLATTATSTHDPGKERATMGASLVVARVTQRIYIEREKGREGGRRPRCGRRHAARPA